MLKAEDKLKAILWPEEKNTAKASKRGQGVIGFLFEEAGKLALSQNIYSIKIS